MCRYAEDCALVMNAIAKPDDRDMSVSGLPFNYNAQLDVRKVRIGYIKESFETITVPAAKAAAQSVLDTLTKLGVAKFIPLTIPEWPYDGSAITVESAVFFDEFVRSGGVARMTNPGRGAGFKSGRLVPAVEYLQAQRARMMMMMKLAEVTAGVDVYLVASAGTPGGGARGAAPAAPPPTPTPAGRHSTMANLACYPAVNIVPGFAESGLPLSMTFFARPFGDGELLAVAKAYQDAAGNHLKHPPLV
jgi:Asp-tRNA(Asn)/Glu-tRNA(Gln) amidotransferase A subunit family amidase